MINQTIIAITRQFPSVNDSAILFKIYSTQVIWRNGKTHKMCNLTLEKLHLGRLQWIDFNNCEIHLIHKEADLRGQVCLWNSLARKCLKNSVIWNSVLQTIDFLKSRMPFLKFWLFESAAMAVLSVFSSTYSPDLQLSN
jgi:hypothetical protein